MFPKIRFLGSVTVGSKGQVVIPADAREALDIKEGDKLVVLGNPSKKGIAFIKAESIEELLQHMQTGLDEIQKSTYKAKGGTNA